MLIDSLTLFILLQNTGRIEEIYLEDMIVLHEFPRKKIKNDYKAFKNLQINQVCYRKHNTFWIWHYLLYKNLI